MNLNWLGSSYFWSNFRTFSVVFLLPVFVIGTLFLGGRISVSGYQAPVQEASAALEGGGGGGGCTPDCSSSCNSGSQLCWDSNCNFYTQPCSPPPPPPLPPPSSCPTGAPCNGEANQCISSCEVGNLEGTCRSNGTCGDKVMTPHNSCGPNTVCSGGSCVSSPGSCGGTTTPPPSVTCGSCDCTSGLKGCTDGTARPCLSSELASCPPKSGGGCNNSCAGISCGGSNNCGNICGPGSGCTPFCGDGYCNGSESCSSCRTDCGSCSGGDGSPPGGGGPSCNNSCSGLTCGSTNNCGNICQPGSGCTVTCPSSCTYGCQPNSSSCNTSPGSGGCPSNCNFGCPPGSSTCNSQPGSGSCSPSCTFGCPPGSSSCNNVPPGVTPPTPCSPSWHCQTPYNGQESDGCGNTRSNTDCNPAWFQAGGASVHSNASVSGLVIPSGQYFNPGQYGIVSSNSSFNFTPSQTNTRSWQLINYPSAGTNALTNPRYDHDYFWTKYQGNVARTVNNNAINTGDLQTSSTDPQIIAVHPLAGNSVLVTQPINVTGGKLLVVFVNATSGPVNLTISSSINVGADSAVIWIVSGNVTVDSSVSRADGYYVVSGSFSDGSGSTQLTVNGGVAAYGGFSLGRRNANQSTPSEVFTYNPVISKLGQLIGESNYTWVEAIP